MAVLNLIKEHKTVGGLDLQLALPDNENEHVLNAVTLLQNYIQELRKIDQKKSLTIRLYSNL